MNSNEIRIITILIIITQIILIASVIFGCGKIVKILKSTPSSKTEYVILELPTNPISKLDLDLYRDSQIIQEETELDKPEEPEEYNELTMKEQIIDNVFNICEGYDNVDPYIIQSVIFKESNFRPLASTNNKYVKEKDVGLMQVSMYWHKDRAERLGVTNFYDIYDNILLGVDYISELTRTYKDINLVLMLYNMNHKTAHTLYEQGEVSDYAKSVVALAEVLREE